MPIIRSLVSTLWASLFVSSALAAEAGPVPDTDSIIGANNLKDVESVRGTRFYDMARAVARVENFSRDGFCTAVRVSETLILTNYHCFETAECRVRFRMGFERRLPDVEQSLYECTGVVAKAAELDFVLYRARAVYAHQPSYPFATLSKFPLEAGQPLVASGHPILQRKKIDVSASCQVTLASPYVHEGVISMQHQCDTQGGSSGSPIFDRASGHVVALHWAGEDGTGSNHGVPMSLILGRIHETDADLYGELTIVE